MDPVSGMLLGGAALGGLNSMLGVGASAVDAALQYHYAKKMYQHRYQWAMKDMAKAGLNPVLAANGGNVSGMGSAPSTDFAGAVNSGVNSAMQAARTVSDLQAQQVTNAKTEADQKLAEANTGLVKGKKLTQDIENMYLEPKARALAEKAQSEASIANSADVIQSARASWADVMARGDANYAMERGNLAGYRAGNEAARWRKLWSDPEGRLTPEERKSLYLREKEARILERQLRPLWQSVNSATGVMRLGY